MAKTWCESSVMRLERARSLVKHLPTREERECVEWLLEQMQSLHTANETLAVGMRTLSAICERRWDMLHEAAGLIPLESDIGQRVQDELDNGATGE